MTILLTVATGTVRGGRGAADQQIDAGESDGDIAHPLAVKLRNSLKQAEHQLE